MSAKFSMNFSNFEDIAEIASNAFDRLELDWTISRFADRIEVATVTSLCKVSIVEAIWRTFDFSSFASVGTFSRFNLCSKGLSGATERYSRNSRRFRFN